MFIFFRIVHCAGAILRIQAATAGAVALAPVPGAGPSRKQQEGARGLPYAPPASLSTCLQPLKDGDGNRWLGVIVEAGKE